MSALISILLELIAATKISPVRCYYDSEIQYKKSFPICKSPMMNSPITRIDRVRWLCKEYMPRNMRRVPFLLSSGTDRFHPMTSSNEHFLRYWPFVQGIRRSLFFFSDLRLKKQLSK